MRVTGVDACRRGWVAVSLEGPTAAGGLPAARTGAGGPLASVWTGASLAELLQGAGIVGIDMPLGLLESGWREADKLARGLLGPRRSSVFAIPPRAVWAEDSYPAANLRCRALTGQGLSAQAWGLRRKLLEANAYRQTCGHPLYEVHPELAFCAMAGQPLALSKHTAAGLHLRRRVLAEMGIEVPAGTVEVPAGTQASAAHAGAMAMPTAMAGDILDAAAVAWSARRIPPARRSPSWVGRSATATVAKSRSATDQQIGQRPARVRPWPSARRRPLPERGVGGT